jgi:hypothetical protein
MMENYHIAKPHPRYGCAQYLFNFHSYADAITWLRANSTGPCCFLLGMLVYYFSPNDSWMETMRRPNV